MKSCDREYETRNIPQLFLACFLCAAFLLSCVMPDSGKNANLRLILSSDSYLQTAFFDVTAEGPDGEQVSLSMNAIESSATHFFRNLLYGEWTIAVIARNKDGNIVARVGPRSVILEEDKTLVLEMPCVPLPADGAFSLTLTWPEAAVPAPGMEASLIPISGGDAIPLSFVISGNSGSGTSGSLDDGNYLLSINLLDGGTILWPFTSLVVISGRLPVAVDWQLVPKDGVQSARPGMELMLNSTINTPIIVTLSDSPGELLYGSSMHVTAAAEPEPESWQWYLDGVPVEWEEYPEIWIGDALENDSVHSLAVVARKDDKTGIAATGFRVTTRSVATLAGSGLAGSANGAALESRFRNPTGIALDTDGTIYISDTGSNKIRRLESGNVITFAGGVSASLNAPTGIAMDASANIFVADTCNNKIRKISPEGTVSLFAGSGEAGWTDGTGSASSFDHPAGLAVDASGNVFVADTYNHKIRKISADGRVSTFAGSGYAGTRDGTGISASFNHPTGLAIDASGNLFVCDTENNLVRRIAPSGAVSTYAGSGSPGNNDGDLTAASFQYPSGIAVDSQGNVYVADTGNNRIRRIAPDGYVTTLAGTGFTGSADGVLSGASFDSPSGIAVDGDGLVYVADTKNNRIRTIAQ